MANPRRTPFTLGGVEVKPGSRVAIDLPLGLMSDHTPITMSVSIMHGRRPGPVLLVAAAVHGDEINGVEIIRRLLRRRRLASLKGTLIAVPVVNMLGFLAGTRYLPDRRDLNRSFPGSPRGSLTARLANLFLTEIVSRCSHGIDLHTGAVHRDNLPQVRGDLSDPMVRDMAEAFAMPVTLNAALRPGSLRQAAIKFGVPMLVFEGGEALRFDEIAIQAGLQGVLRVMVALGMIPTRKKGPPKRPSVTVKSSTWVRSPEGGILRSAAKLGTLVQEGDSLGIVADPFGVEEFPVTATTAGIIIGRSNLPVVNPGDGLFHIARFADTDTAEETVGTFYDDWEQETISV